MDIDCRVTDYAKLCNQDKMINALFKKKEKYLQTLFL